MKILAFTLLFLATGAQAQSQSGALTPPASSITDSNGSIWTINNGIPELNGKDVSLNEQTVNVLAYYSNPYSSAVYQQLTSNCGWFNWYTSQNGQPNSGGWNQTAQPPVGGLPSCQPGGTPPVIPPTCPTGDTGTYPNCVAPPPPPVSTTTPAPALSAGYTVQTFGPAVSLGSNWYNWGFYGSGPQASGAVTVNANGTLLLSGIENNNYGASIATAEPDSNSLNWAGNAFGGGAYFEATLSFTGQGTGPYPNGGPAFWMLDIEHLSIGPYNINWPSAPAGCIDFFEVDAMEYDASNTYGYQNGIATWYGSSNNACANGATYNPNTQIPGVAGGVLVPTGTDFSQPHKYGLLWVPAVGSQDTTQTQGYLKFYFDDVQVGSTFYWNYYDPTLTSTYPAFPPVNGTSAMSGMDWRHMVLILGTGPAQPMTVYGVSVWQHEQNLQVRP